MKHVEEWISGSSYCRALGIECEDVSRERCILRLPFRETNANPGGVLHGGVAASLSACAGQAVARAALGPEIGPWHTANLQINYLAAASGETLIAEGRLLRNGKDLCYAAIEIRGQDSKPIANAIVLVRGRLGAAAAAMPARLIDVPRMGPAPMAERISKNGFIANRGMRMTYQQSGTCVVQMPWQESNGEAGGGLHEGAALALLDTAGAMACFTLTGFTAERASTPSIQAQMFVPLPATGVEAHARVAFRDGDLFWSDAEICGIEDGLVYARGTVVYRVVPAK